MLPNASFTRVAGWAAIASPLLYIASSGAAIASRGAPSAIGLALVSISTLLLLIVLAALYATYRATAPLLSLVGALALAISSVGGLLLDPSTITPTLGAIGLLFAAGMGALGWLALRSPTTPRGLSVLALMTGVLALAQAIAAFAGVSADLFGLLNLILTLPYAAWLLWLGRLWLTPNGAAQAQPR